MTPIADMVEKLAAEGVPMHVIVLAVRTAELATINGKVGGHPVDKAAENRRAYDRERMAKKRKVGGCPVDSPPTTETASSFKGTQKDEEGRKEEAKPKRRSGHSLPADWRPSADHYGTASEMRMTRAQVDAKAEEMRLWARANGHRAVARKLDWDATFTGWMRRDWGSNGARNGSGPAGPKADKSVSGAADRILERLRDLDSPGEPH